MIFIMRGTEYFVLVSSGGKFRWI